MAFKIEEYGDILTPEDVRKILGIGWNKTYSLLAEGVIRNFKIGSRRKITKQSLIDYIEASQIDTAAIHKKYKEKDNDNFTQNQE